MSQVRLVRTLHLQYDMKVEGTDGHARKVSWISMGWTSLARLDIGFQDGTVIRDSHSLTLWRLT